MLNLTHRDSHERPSPVEPGRQYDVDVVLDASSWVFEPGHAVRIAVTGADYPLLWPSPHPYDLTIEVGGGAPSRLTLPVVPTRDDPLPRARPARGRAARRAPVVRVRARRPGA